MRRQFPLVILLCATLAAVACRIPAAPDGAGRFVLTQADGIPLPAILDTTDSGWGASEVLLLSAEVELRRGGEVRWTRTMRLEQLDPATPGGWEEERVLRGWYAVDGDRIEMEILTDGAAGSRTVRVTGVLQPASLVLLVPGQARARTVESYVPER